MLVYCFIGVITFNCYVVLGGIGMSHNPSEEFWKPFRMSSKFLNILRFSLSNNLSHPSSASCPRDIMDWLDNPDRVWASFAMDIRIGMLSCPEPFEVNVDDSGSVK